MKYVQSRKRKLEADVVLLWFRSRAVTQVKTFYWQQKKQQNKIWNMFKVDKKDTRAMALTFFWCLYFFNFEHVSHTLVVFLLLMLSMYLFTAFGIVTFQSIFWLAFLDFIYLKNCFSRNIFTMWSTQTLGLPWLWVFYYPQLVVFSKIISIVSME